jgi:hypothetical protein
MKNYTYGWMLRDNGYVEVSEDEYTESQVDMKNYIDSMSELIKDTRCGWSGVKYKVLKFKDDTVIGHREEYMVLWVSDGGSRWIPITGNSKGCNFSVLGENLW